MSTPKGELSREAIRRSLMSRAGNAPDASVVAEATLNIWQQMSALLTPIIGMLGVDALFSRSLHLTSKAFPWLVIAGDNGDNGDNTALFLSFKARLAGSGTNDAIEASCALFVSFIELLSALIGESLTRRLLRPVWKFSSQKIKQETKSWTPK